MSIHAHTASSLPIKANDVLLSTWLHTKVALQYSTFTLVLKRTTKNAYVVEKRILAGLRAGMYVKVNIAASLRNPERNKNTSAVETPSPIPLAGLVTWISAYVGRSCVSGLFADYSTLVWKDAFGKKTKTVAWGH